MIGEVPRTGDAGPRLEAIEARFAQKYFGTASMFHDGRHGWLQVTPAKIASWDFRKTRRPVSGRLRTCRGRRRASTASPPWQLVNPS